MIRRGVLLPAVAAAVVLVATVGGSSPAHPDGRSTGIDLLASAHPSAATPTVVDRAYDARGWVRGHDVSADTAALTSATCDGCAGESTTLQVLYANRSRRARLDNVATAWAQECSGCTGTALSVQVVVLRGRPTTVPSNRAVSLTAACASCRTSALAYQVVLVADDARPLDEADLTGLRAWFEEQAAALRASVAEPLPEPLPEPPAPTQEPTPTDEPTPTTSPSPELPGPGASPRRARRDAVSALAQLEALLTDALDAEAVAADVDLSR